MKESELFTRLLRRRPISFWTDWDKYILATTARERQLQVEGRGGFENIGSESQSEPLVLKDYLSYDEMQISALVSMVVPTLFINNGSRSSKCLPGEPGSFQDSGVMVACVGARMVKRMEAEHMLVTPEHDAFHGYGPQGSEAGARLSAWADFYEIDHFPSYDEAQSSHELGRYLKILSPCDWCRKYHDDVWTDGGRKYCRSCMAHYYDKAPDVPPEKASYLDCLVYKRRIRKVVEPFLAYASHLGSVHRDVTGCGAHVRVKGLGLGAWCVTPEQEVLMKDVYAEILKAKELLGIDVLEFAFFPSDSEDFPIHSRIEVKASKCGFSEYVGKRLLIVMYAWDGNAHAGNEWWAESGSGHYLGMTDDSAAASCSLITSLQHPVVNIGRHCAESAQLLTRDECFRAFSDCMVLESK